MRIIMALLLLVIFFMAYGLKFSTDTVHRLNQKTKNRQIMGNTPSPILPHDTYSLHWGNEKIAGEEPEEDSQH